MKIKINKMGINGEGIGYDSNKKPIFVPNALIDEEVEVKITEDFDTYAKAELVKIYNKSKFRVVPKCKYQHICDGCSLMHTMVKNQLLIKKNIVAEALYKYADIPSSLVSNTEPSKLYYGYRNQFKFPVKLIGGKLECGMYKEGTNHIVTLPKCIIHEKNLEEIRFEVMKVLNKYGIKDYYEKITSGLRYIVVRGFEDGYMLTLVTGKNDIPNKCIDDLSKIKGIKSIYQNINTRTNHIIMTDEFVHLYGDETINVKVNDFNLNLSPNSFFQLNLAQAQNLYNYVINKIEPCNTIMEAYSGIGAMSIMVAEKANRVVGVEYIKNAVINANNNAELNGLSDKVEFICDDAGTYLTKFDDEIDCLIVDPPRSGLDNKMINAILGSGPKQLIYISCNPSTLGKNLEILQREYLIESIKPFDMFTNTPHVETVVLLRRVD